MASDYSTKAPFCNAARALLNRAATTLCGGFFFFFLFASEGDGLSACKVGQNLSKDLFKHLAFLKSCYETPFVSPAFASSLPLLSFFQRLNDIKWFKRQRQ